MKHLYINLSAIVVGGGLQNAINFLLNLEPSELTIKNFSILIRENSPLEKICKEKSYPYILVPQNFWGRLKHEIFFFRNKPESLIFTLFGTKPLFSGKSLTITGCAYSNLFYPKINFWGHLPKVKRNIKKVKDLYRFYNVKSSDVVIFETDLLKEKAINQFSFTKKHTYTVKMAINSTVQKGTKFINFNIDNSKFNILYLGSAHPNKRQHLIPNLVKEMLDYGLKDFKFLLTMNEKDSYAKEVLTSIKTENLEHFIVNLGFIPNHKISTLIEQSNAMINIAQLESFSNNFVEAWKMEKVLLLTDDEWARDACGEAAIYLDLNNPNHLLKQIKNALEEDYAKKIIKKGIEQLSNYPSAKEKNMQFIQIINQYSKKGVI